MTPETAIFEGLETLLRLARDARAGGGGQGPMAVAGSVVEVFSRGATPIWSRGGTGKGRFEEGGDARAELVEVRKAHPILTLEPPQIPGPVNHSFRLCAHHVTLPETFRGATAG